MPYRVRHSSTTRNRALKRLFAIQEFSLANYASQARLYAGDSERKCLAKIVEIANRQTAHAAEIGKLLSARRVFLQREAFPMYLTRLNYLSAAYVTREMLEKQPELLKVIRECLEHLHGDQEGQAVAHRILASEEENLRHLNRIFGKTSDPAVNWRTAA